MKRFRLVLVLLGVLPSLATAQATVSDELAVAGVNTLLGAGAAGISAWIRGESFTEAFAVGALGGSVVYGGKRLASARFDGAGLAGRFVAATGNSVMRNAGSGRGALDELVLPVGPVTLYWRTRDSAGVSAKLDLGQTGYLAYLTWHEGYEIDWPRTLSGGVPVFLTPGRLVGGRVDGGRPILGTEGAGVINMSDPAALPPGRDYDGLVGHERVHVLQHDFLSVTVAAPIENWLLERLPGGDVLGRYVHIGGIAELLGGALNLAVPLNLRPWEREACYLDARFARRCP